MFKLFLKFRNPLLWISLHFLIGLSALFTNYIFILFFYVTLISSIYSFLSENKGDYINIYLLTYLTSFEVFARMLNCSPFIPYEVSKYLMLVLLLFGIILSGKMSWKGLILLFLLIPAFFYDYSDKVEFNDIVFNVLGSINLSLSVWYFSNVKLSSISQALLLRCLLFPILSVLFYTIFKSPDIDNLNFHLEASKNFTGGFGSNQVSTIFGLAIFLIFVIFSKKYSISGYFILDILIYILFILFALLSFSRGGMIGGVCSLLIYLFINSRSRNIFLRLKSFKSFRIILLLFLFFLLSLIVVNSITNGALFLRYKGQTEGTITDGDDITLNKITTGRLGIFTAEYDLFSEYLLGVGAGASQYMRSFRSDLSSHTELGRLISEHGILGFGYFLILILIIIKKLLLKNDAIDKGFSIALLFLALFTSFHAATRTYITPLLFGLGTIDFYFVKRSK